MSANTAVGIVLGLILGDAGSHLFEGPGFMTKAARAKDLDAANKIWHKSGQRWQAGGASDGSGPGRYCHGGLRARCHCLLLVECAHLGVELPDWANPVDLVAPGRVN